MYIFPPTVDPDTTATLAQREFTRSVDDILEARPWSRGRSIAHQMKFFVDREARFFHRPYVLEYLEDELRKGRARVLGATLDIVPVVGNKSQSAGGRKITKIDHDRAEKDGFTESRLFREHIPNLRYMTRRQRTAAVNSLETHQ